MGNANDRLNRYIANTGAGVDAAGRPSYSGGGPAGMYASPAEQNFMMAEHGRLKAAAAAEDPQGHLIRELLDQLKMKNLPGNVDIPVYPIAPAGNFTYSHQEGK